MKSIKLFAVGDILLSESVAELIRNKGPKEPFVFVLDEFKKSDLLFGNLECPLSNRGKPLKNKCCLCSPPETVKSLKHGGFNILSLANNHIFDYGYEGFKDTVVLLEENNISWFGAGKNLEEARKPAILSIDNLSIGFLGYAWDFIGSINGTKNNFGTAPLNEKIILEDVKNLKGKIDKMIVSLHWSYDKEKYPLPSQRDLAHKIIDAGADLILGHHPHVLQGIEKYGNGVIVYSLGNFIFPDIFFKNYQITQKSENKESIIFECKMSRDEIKNLDIIPARTISLPQPKILKGEDKELTLRKIEKLSERFKLNNYSYFWRKNRIRKDLRDVNQHIFHLYYYKILRLTKFGRAIIKKVIKCYIIK